MERSKRSRSDDRLSELPESLIFEIFRLLPITDVVKTTILSKRWKDLWTTFPFLKFDQFALDRFNNDDLDGLQDFVNQVLILWRGVKVVEFKIKLRLKSFVRDIGAWLRFATEKQVEELYFELYDNAVDLDFECLVSCSSSLKALRLRGCRFQIVGNVKWDGLKSLHLDGNCLNQDGITKILCGSPKLEELFWSFLDSEESLCIRSTSLKKLSIGKYNGCSSNDISRNTEMEIRTPNLKRLEIVGLPYAKFLLSASSVTDLTLEFLGRKHCIIGNLDAFLGESLKQILPAIERVDRATLSAWCVKVLEGMNKKGMVSPLLNVKFLKLNTKLLNQAQVADLLRVFPEMNWLAIRGIDEEKYLDDGEFEANLPNSFLMQLTTVDFMCCKFGKWIFSCIEIILKYASKLEKVVLRVPTTFGMAERHSVSQKLLRMARASPTVKVIFGDFVY